MDKAHKTYQKPAGIKYTDMAIYIDKHSYDENRSEEVDALIYEYLYHLVYALSLKKNYFKNYQDYDSFACYGAMRVFSRLINKNQFREEKPLKKIKSVLNYIKSVLYAFKTDYQKENYVEILNPELGTGTFQLQEDINDSIQSSYSYNKEEDVKELLTQGFEIIKKIVYNTPYKNTPEIRHKLELSLLLSFINSFTLPPRKESNLINRTSKAKPIINKIQTYYNDINQKSVVLWHLNKSMTDYVKLLYNKFKLKILYNIMDIQSSYKLDDGTLKAIKDSVYQVEEDLMEVEY